MMHASLKKVFHTNFKVSFLSKFTLILLKYSVEIEMNYNHKKLVPSTNNTHREKSNKRGRETKREKQVSVKQTLYFRQFGKTLLQE